jgi:hypothetical protein
MLVTDASWFEVVRKQNGNLRLEVRGSRDQGRRISVPVRHETYDGETERTLTSLSVGDECQVVLQSDSESAPDWRVQTIEEVDKVANQRTDRAGTHSSARSSETVSSAVGDSA